MRIILWVGCGVAALWGGYWFVGSSAIAGGVTQWFAAQEAQGVIATQDGIAVSGFPNRFDLTVTAPSLSDPTSGWGWTAPFAQVLSMTWKPWHVIAVLPQDQQIHGPGQKIHIESSYMAASARLAPSTDLTLNEVIIEGRDLRAVSDMGWQMGTRSAVLAMARDPSQPFGQRLGLEIADLAPDPRLAALVPELGGLISAVHLDATLVLSAELDRHMGQTLPGLTGAVVRDFHMTWGSLRIEASGQVDRGADGLAVGQIDFRIQNWRQIPELMVAMGLVLPDMGKTITKGMEVMAQAGPDPDVLDLPLVFSEGWMSLGPLPLGPAPRLD